MTKTKKAKKKPRQKSPRAPKRYARVRMLVRESAPVDLDVLNGWFERHFHFRGFRDRAPVTAFESGGWAPGYWRTADGRTLRIEEMVTDHLENALRLLERKTKHVENARESLTRKLSRLSRKRREMEIELISRGL